ATAKPGGGARAPKAAAKRPPLRRRPAQAVAPLPCPSPFWSRSRCSGFPCERHARILRTGGRDRPEAPRQRRGLAPQDTQSTTSSTGAFGLDLNRDEHFP